MYQRSVLLHMENVELVRIMHISEFQKTGKGIFANQVSDEISS